MALPLPCPVVDVARWHSLFELILVNFLPVAEERALVYEVQLRYQRFVPLVLLQMYRTLV